MASMLAHGAPLSIGIYGHDIGHRRMPRDMPRI